MRKKFSTRLLFASLMGVLLLQFSMPVFPMFSVPIAYAVDSIPPGAITDLGTTQTSSTSITISWTAPGNDGSTGTATSYDLRYSTDGVITETTWAAATAVSGEPTPSVAGSAQSMLISSLAASTRYWFALKTSDGTNVSAISNSPANLISDLSQVNVLSFNNNSYDARDRRLMRVIQPDYIHRSAFEWEGTQFQDRSFEGSKQSLDRLTKDGSMIGGGISANYWAPSFETIGPGVVVAQADAGNVGWSPTTSFVNRDSISGQNQLIYKAKKQIDNGFYGVEFDEYFMNGGHLASDIAQVMNTVRSYALSTFNRKVYISANSDYGGQMGWSYVANGTEAVDYYLNNYPIEAGKIFDGTVNHIPSLRTHSQTLSPKPVFYFVDFGSPYDTSGPDFSKWVNFTRVDNAQILASGAFPAQGRSFYNTIDGYQLGVFTQNANIAKFMKENKLLWHNLTWITPATLTTSISNVWKSAFSQTGRTILHLVNGNYNNTTQVMTTKTNFTTSITLASAPSRVWITTPDKPASTRKQILSTSNYTYSGGVLTITIPELQFHDVIVIEQGTAYDPVYSPMQVIFPFENPKNLPVGNKFHIIPLQTEGFSQNFTWYVNGIAGGNSTVGTVDSNGYYTAPSIIPSGGVVTIKAVSQEMTTIFNQFDLTITSAPSVPWNDAFTSDTVGQVPANWAVIDGYGDWKLDLDGATKVLHNFNLSDGSVQAGTAQYSPLIASGNQSWTNYNYKYSVKTLKTPLVWYGDPGSKPDTHIGIVFRFKDNKNYYEYRLCYDNQIRLFKTVNGITTSIGLPAPAAFPAVNTYVDLEVKLTGASFQMYVNNALVRSDSDNSIASGGIGITTDLTENEFKNIAVTANTGSTPGSIATTIDDLTEYSKIFSHSANLFFDGSTPLNLGGDTSRLARTTNTSEAIIYKAALGMDLNHFAVDTWFWPSEPTIDFQFYTSPDNTTYSLFMPLKSAIAGASGIWNEVSYSGSLPIGTQYLKIVYMNTTANAFNPQIGKAVISSQIPIVDNLNDYSLSYAHSANLYFDGSNPANLGGDTSRLARTTNSSESIVFQSLSGTDMTTFSTDTWFYPGEAMVDYQLYSSPDNSNYTLFTPVKATTFGTGSGWNKVVYSGLLPAGTKYLKMVFPTTINAWNPQIGAFKYGSQASLTDNLNDFSYSATRSFNLYFDGSSSVNLGGDTSRLTRSTNSFENIVYAISLAHSMSVDTWFWPGEAKVDFKFYYSPDNITYTSLSPTLTNVTGTGSNWNKTTYTGTLPIGTRYLKIEYRNTSSNPWNPQLGKVILK
ncbi:hypothetical protein EHS13_09595 [Paenibacillus psychroresistens]|uniref:Fibronectin type-III domain-containing protein n=1 Tax=Paenibacillus psychroresistens TaxID=1778678 RepID=A0A6B8RF54_9BACL|nr:hypothetical protein [Paenibacillus psychroresistens]QGQ95121.1 hypothetical protein EHS13_09595 [Paenibacillus psychroresistens]